MRAPTQLRRSLLAGLFVIAVATLASCAAPATNGNADTSRATDARAVDTPAEPDAARSGQAAPSSPASEQPPMRTGGPLPPERVGSRKPDPNIEPVVIDASCRTDADCTVKNVGNCCGYYPACVNVNSPTDPQGVQARCAREGMASVCGFQEITACSCNQGHCEAESSEMVQ
jgi:hypothetical protein